MKPIRYAALALASAGSASAALCGAGGLLGLGIGNGISTLDSTFVLQARAPNGTLLTVKKAQLPATGTFLFPVSLAEPNTPFDDPSIPVFQLQGGAVYATGGTVFATQNTPLLGPETLYVGADGTQHQELFNAVNGTCEGKDVSILRFTNLLPLPIASAVTNGTFAPGAGLASPILDNILTLGSPVDLVIVPYTAGS